MFSRLVRYPAKSFNETSSGRLLSKIAYDVTGVTDAATSALTVLIKDSIVIVLLLSYLFYLNWKLTLVAFLVGPPIAYTVRVISKRLRRVSREALVSQGDLVHVLQETIECQKVIKVFGGQDYETRRFDKSARALRGTFMRINVSQALTTPITHTFAAFAIAIIVYIALQDSLAGRTTVGEFASFLTAMLMLLAPLKHLSEINNSLQRGLAAAESVFGVIDAPVEEDRGSVVLLGRRQDHARQPAAALLCAERGPRAARWPRPAERDARQPARQYRARQPGDRAVQRLDLRQHRLRRHGRRAREGRDRRGRGRARDGFHPRDARRPQHADR